MEKKCTIHEVAELLSISTDAIRLYEKEGLVAPMRNPENSYRYYDTDQIRRIMAISLYRQLDISIADIKNLLLISSFDDLSVDFFALIDETECKIAHLQKRADKLRIMKSHFESIQCGIHTCSIQLFPECRCIYHQDSPDYNTDGVKQIVGSPLFSFGHFCYSLKKSDHGEYNSCDLQFIIRKSMLDICPWSICSFSFPKQPETYCLYTVSSISSSDCPHWDLDTLLGYAQKNNLSVASYAYAIYAYSLNQNESIMDFYEIYLPIINRI